MNPLRILVSTTLGLVVWAAIIGPEEEFPDPPPAASASPTLARSKSSAARTSPNLGTEQISGIDSRLFRLGFMRQAKFGLWTCLQQWQPGRHELTLSATLSKANGKLSSIRSVGSELPDCASKLIGDMSFTDIVSTMNRDELDLQWRVDF